MLLIPNYIARSSIHGFGVFTAVHIDCGQKVWQFDPSVDRTIFEGELANMSHGQRRLIHNHAEYFPAEGKYILGLDGDYYMNHSAMANLSDFGDTMLAKIAIPAGAELTCDYEIVKVRAFNPSSANTPCNVPRGPDKIHAIRSLSRMAKVHKFRTLTEV